MKWLNNWLYGLEQRFAKWRKQNSTAYKAGRLARRHGQHKHENPFNPYSENAQRWFDGWFDEGNGRGD